VKKYVIIAGVNGAEKSTLYQTIDSLQNMPRVNVDEIVREVGDWRSLKDVLFAGKIAVNKIEQYMREGISFNQETTLCGKSILKKIMRAKELGFFVEMHYVGVDSVQIAKDRVRHRVENGGHGIPEEDIEKRYIETFQQLNSILQKCNLVAFYDNTERFRRFAICKDGKLIRISQNIPAWFSKIKI